VANKAQGRHRNGVQEHPIFSLPIEHIIWPLLHALIGIGNQLLNFVIDYAEEYIQCLSNKERLLRDRVRQLERAVADAREGIER
jgi:hypothetical protein